MTDIVDGELHTRHLRERAIVFWAACSALGEHRHQLFACDLDNAHIVVIGLYGNHVTITDVTLFYSRAQTTAVYQTDLAIKDGAEGVGQQVADGRLLTAHQPFGAFQGRQVEVCGGNHLTRRFIHQLLDAVGGSGDGIIGIRIILLSHQCRHELTLTTDPQFTEIIELGSRLGGGHEHMVQVRHRVTFYDRVSMPVEHHIDAARGLYQLV